MDPDEVSEVLQGLTEIEEMLIAQIFPIVSVYCLCEVNMHTMVTLSGCVGVCSMTPRNPSSLDVLVVRCNSFDVPKSLAHFSG